MLTTIERVIALQEVDIFSQVSTEHLAYLAAIAKEENVAAGQPVYLARDPAEAMYLVIEGKVRLHLDQLEINIVSSGDPFGTWALFDEEPRVSAATAMEDSLLLRLDKEDFIDLLADNIDITQGVLKALVKRMRDFLGRVGGGAS
jgi:CRP-like cAMP-binding protein